MTYEVKDGRPFKYTDPAELRLKIQNYFDGCDPHLEKRLVDNGVNTRGEAIFTTREVLTKQIPYTITDLALALGVSRATLVNYRKPDHWANADISEETKQELLFTIYEAIQKIEGFNERALHKPGVANGVKFNLTNNFGWVDKQVIDNNNKNVEATLDDLDDPKEQRMGVADAAKQELEGTEDAAEPAPAPQE